MSAKANLADFTIRVASQAQKDESLVVAYALWGEGMGIDNFEKFKQRFDNFTLHDKWLSEGSVYPWVLVRRDDLDGPIYSYCVTYRRHSILKEPGQNYLKEVYSYCISAVMTPKQHRRNGFATHLLRLLHYQLAAPSAIPPFPAAWGASPPALSAKDRLQLPYAIASMLFSGVGPTFYSRATIGESWPGWNLQNEKCPELGWKLLPPTPGNSESTPSGWAWIYTRDLPAIGARLSEKKRGEMLAQHQDSTTAVWSPDPSTTGTLSHVISQAHRPRSEDWTTVYDTHPCGVRIPGRWPGQPEAIVLFANSEKLLDRPVLLVTYVQDLEPEGLPLLLEALDVAGAQAGMKEAVVWGIDPGRPLGKAWLSQQGREVKALDQGNTEAILGVAWYGKPEERGTLVDTQIWYCR